MIRLGSLAGYVFDGPRLLAGWTPPAAAAVFAVLYRPEPDARPDRYAVIYVDHADDLTAAGLPLRHPASHRWVERAGSRWKLHVCTYEVPGGSRAHRAEIVRELLAVYRPRCNDERYDHSWRDEWIGEYSAPATTRPLADRDPAGGGSSPGGPD